jgi:carboxymethylenebutenolidase
VPTWLRGTVETSPAALDDLVGYLAVPVATSDRPGPWPGVVLVHDAFGLGDDMREQADWLAAAGYVVAVPDLYGGRSAIRCLKGTFAQLARRRGPAFDRLDAVRAALSADRRCTGPVGVIGYCMGGGFALLLAGQPGWSAASVNYGQVPDDVADVLAGACPVVASFGGLDKGLPGAAARVRAAAEATGTVADVREYPGARHGFINRLTAASPLTPLLKVAGIGYDHDAAADAKRRILAFFDTHLRGPGA